MYTEVISILFFFQRMDSHLKFSSLSLNALDCLLCKETFWFENENKTNFINHLQKTHQIKFNQNLIVAITFLDNDTRSSIINQFEREQNEVVKEKVGIKDEGLLIETVDLNKADKDIGENGSPNKSYEAVIKVEPKIHQCESCDKSFTNRAALNMHSKKRHQNNEKKRKFINDDENTDVIPASKKMKINSEPKEKVAESTTKTLDYDYIISCSEYFKKNPKQITSKCNPSLHSTNIFSQIEHHLPSDWKLREHVKEDGTLEEHFLAPDGRVLKSRRAAMEYMNVLGKYTAEEIKKVNQVNVRNVQKKRNSIENSVQAIKALQGDNGNRETTITEKVSVKQEPINTFGDLWNHLKPVEATSDEVTRKQAKFQQAISEIDRNTQVDESSATAKEDQTEVEKSKKVEQAMKSRRSGVGVECPECFKVVGHLKRHLEDVHSPPGHFPCLVCNKVFKSRNSENSHRSRNHPNRPKK